MFKRGKSRSRSKPSISWPIERDEQVKPPLRSPPPPMPALPANPPPPPPVPTLPMIPYVEPLIAQTGSIMRAPSVTYHRPRTSGGPATSSPTHTHSSRPSDGSVGRSSTFSDSQSPPISPTQDHRRSISTTTKSPGANYHAVTAPFPVLSNRQSSADHFYRHNQVVSPTSSPYSRDMMSQSNCSTGTCSTSPTDVSTDALSEFELPEDVPESEEAPTDAKWAAAGEIPIFDSEGQSRKFKTLYEGETAIGEQQLIIFVRHFFCGACQAYLKTLSTALPLETYFSLPTPSSITIIGLGSPKLIPFYRQTTGTPFPIYTDPSRSLYKKLGMSWTMKPGARVDYMDNMSEWKWVSGQVKQLREIDSNNQNETETRHLKFRGGNPMWVGGEVLVREGKIVWMRRMKNYRGHVGTTEIKRLLGAEA